ncbi:MAG TPA: nuclear transport factor 2 family protein [Candidatus Binatia bacterium]|nr:nuclear transport factor 2 family protein [Candidatus Binatia bacterium]
MCRLLAAISIALVLGTALAQSPKQSESGPEAAIRGVLHSQVDAWNRHDLEGFMAGYWKSPELTFVSGTAETQGWEPTLERYRRTYQAEGRAMGTLSFSELRVEALGSDAAFATGKFQLVMPDGKQPHGVFTLIFRRFPEGWRIVRDHTCSQ